MSHQPYRSQAAFDPADDPIFEPVRAPAPTPEQARFFARMRWMMMISGAATILGIAIVLGVIGYRVFKREGSTPPDLTEPLPKGAKIIGTTVAGERIAIMIDAGGSVEVRTFDLKTLRPSGRLKFAPEP